MNHISGGNNSRIAEGADEQRRCGSDIEATKQMQNLGDGIEKMANRRQHGSDNEETERIRSGTYMCYFGI